MIIVVSDTSPVRALHHLGLLATLSNLYGQVLVPPAVERELQAPPTQLQSISVADFDFIVVQSPQDTTQVQRFLRQLHLGESEALALAMEVGAAAVLIDDAAGRKAAVAVGVRPLGTLGVLLEAKAYGLVPAVGPLIDRLIDELGFFISTELKLKVMQLAGE